MNELSLTLNERTAQGKQAAKLRGAGIVPSVIYGGKSEPILTQSPLVETTKLIHDAGRHAPVKLAIGSKQKLAMIKRIDVDPVKHRVRHVSFHAIKQNEKIAAQVPIVLKGMGESVAEKQGLVILQALDALEVKALPARLPESLELNVDKLTTTDDKLTVGDVVLPEGVEFAELEPDLGIVIANVYEPGALQAANEAAAGESETAVMEEETEAPADEAKS